MKNITKLLLTQLTLLLTLIVTVNAQPYDESQWVAVDYDHFGREVVYRYDTTFENSGDKLTYLVDMVTEITEKRKEGNTSYTYKMSECHIHIYLNDKLLFKKHSHGITEQHYASNHSFAHERSGKIYITAIHNNRPYVDKIIGNHDVIVYTINKESGHVYPFTLIGDYEVNMNSPLTLIGVFSKIDKRNGPDLYSPFYYGVKFTPEHITVKVYGQDRHYYETEYNHRHCNDGIKYQLVDHGVIKLDYNMNRLEHKLYYGCPHLGVRQDFKVYDVMNSNHANK